MWPSVADAVGWASHRVGWTASARVTAAGFGGFGEFGIDVDDLCAAVIECAPIWDVEGMGFSF